MSKNSLSFPHQILPPREYSLYKLLSLYKEWFNNNNASDTSNVSEIIMIKNKLINILNNTNINNNEVNGSNASNVSDESNEMDIKVIMNDIEVEMTTWMEMNMDM